MSEEQRIKVSNIIWSVVGVVATIGYIAVLVLGIGDMEIPVETMAMLPPVVQSGIVVLQTLSGRLIVGCIPLVGGAGVATKVLYNKTKIGRLQIENRKQDLINKALSSEVGELKQENRLLVQRLDKFEYDTKEALKTIPNAKTREIAKRFDEKVVIAKEIVEEVKPTVEKVVKVVKKARK